MTVFNRRSTRPAPGFLRFLAALTMAAGLVLGGLGAPALAEDVAGQQPAAGQQANAADTPQAGAGQDGAGQDSTGQDSAGQDATGPKRAGTQGLALSADDCTPPEQWNDQTQSCEKPGTDDPCTDHPELPVCGDGGGDPEDQCDDGQILVNGVCVPDIDPCTLNPAGEGCGGDNGDGGDNGGGDTPTPPSTGGGSSHPGHHHGNPGHTSSPGTSAGSPEGTVPGSASQASGVTTCDPAVCSTGVTSSAPAPATTPTTQGAGRSTLGNTGAPADSTQVLLLGLGLLGGGFLLVRRPRTATVAAGAHRRDRD